MLLKVSSISFVLAIALSVKAATSSWIDCLAITLTSLTCSTIDDTSPLMSSHNDSTDLLPCNTSATDNCKSFIFRLILMFLTLAIITGITAIRLGNNPAINGIINSCIFIFNLLRGCGESHKVYGVVRCRFRCHKWEVESNPCDLLCISLFQHKWSYAIS